jgi:hypothetical protein
LILLSSCASGVPFRGKIRFSVTDRRWGVVNVLCL